MTTAPTAVTAYPLTQDERMLRLGTNAVRVCVRLTDSFIQNVAVRV